MKSNGMEYRILKDAAGENFKVEVKEPGFMGFERWSILNKIVHEYDDIGSLLHPEYTTENIPSEHISPFSGMSYPGSTWTETAYFESCKVAKEAAQKYSRKYLMKTGWTECKC